MLPPTLKPMLAASAEAPFDSEDHLFEIKWDGIRCLAFIEDHGVRLQSRQLNEITAQFPELACLKCLPSGTVLDGELVVMQNGRPSLHHIQQRVFMQNRRRIEGASRMTPATYLVFDLLYLKGKPLMAEPLRARRQALENVIDKAALPGVLVPKAVPQHGCCLFNQVVRLGLEGIVAKRLDAPYLPGKRCHHWLKIKPKLTPQVLMTISAMASSI